MNKTLQEILENQMVIMEELGDIKFCVMGLLKGHIPDDYNAELLKRIENTKEYLNGGWRKG